jgi:hypothetical protein
METRIKDTNDQGEIPELKKATLTAMPKARSAPKKQMPRNENVSHPNRKKSG